MIRILPTRRAVLLTLVFVLLLALVVVAEIGQSGQNRIAALIQRSQQRQILLANVLHDLSASQAAQRAFLLTADAQQLVFYRAARARIAPGLARLAALSRADATLLAASGEPLAIGQLRRLADTELRTLAAALTLYSAEGPQRAMTLIRADLAQPTMSEINDEAVTVRDGEQRLVEAQLARAARLRVQSRELMGAVALLNVLLLLLAALLLARDAQRRAAQAERLARENERLEGRVRQRTAELSALSSYLQQLSEKEKAALARELHDELGGLLIAVKMDASWLHKRWPNPTPEFEARWARVFKVLDDGVDFKRRVVENLRPTLLDNMGLLPAVRWVAQETCSRAGLQCSELYPDSEPQLTDEAAIAVFRLVQEALTNIVKHAQATHVRLQIELQGEEMLVLIEDNGVGIDPERRDAVGSHGLAIMRHRVRSCGGSLQIDAAAPGGTRVLARLPLAAVLRTARPAPAERAQPTLAQSSLRLAHTHSAARS